MSDPREDSGLLEAKEKAEKELERAASSLWAVDDEDDENIIILDKEIQEKEVARRRAEAEAEEARRKEKEKAKVESAEALRQAPVLEQHSERGQARVLILTKDATVMQEGSLSQKHILELSEMFEEIHVVILVAKGHGYEANKRIADNVWLYPTNSRYWWKLPYDAYKTATQQLMFMKGFRADIIVAEDPFESGLAAHFLAEKYNRALQVHLFDDYFYPEFIEKEKYNNLRLFVERFVLGKADCVRTKSEHLREQVVGKYKDLKPYTEVLPVHYNLDAWKNTEPAYSLKEKYPQFNLFLLCVSAMEQSSHTDKVITGAARTLVQYPTIGLVLVGDGPERGALEEQVTNLGLTGKVIFETETEDVITPMKSADLLIHLAEDEEEDVTIVQAASVGLPMILSPRGIASELFEEGESAFFCPYDTPPCVSKKIGTFLSDNTLRMNFAKNAEDTVFSRIEQDYSKYLRAYRSSIERCVLVGS